MRAVAAAVDTARVLVEHGWQPDASGRYWTHPFYDVAVFDRWEAAAILTPGTPPRPRRCSCASPIVDVDVLGDGAAWCAKCGRLVR